MNAIATYSPTQPDLHLTLPHDHANSILSTSPFSYKLDDEFDFIEVLPGLHGETPKVALDSYLVAAITWAATRTKQIMNRATQGRVPAVAVSAPIPEYMFKNLGMEKPRLALLLERANINPLLNIGDKGQLKRMFRGLQQLGREAVDWIIEARWRSLLLGERSMWDWEDPRILPTLFPVIRDPRLLNSIQVASPPGPDNDNSDSETTATQGTTTPPNSPTLPFSIPATTATYPGPQDDVGLLMQVVLHPTASRYALRHPGADFFGGSLLVNRGYVDSEGEDAMDVDDD
ncbi:hypothetical protein EST38_g6780 [Candolleomyces aberdarensis]|uniref:Uncharacterized protein n=1 Tax=Candolleomyces aberdarensis TaxID=2316362 RepID=A0A4Q2DJS0_9AGAR|nr:hypothetical protein EST38_g6780 [Candolleomyces aberdarensis]